MSNQGKDTNEFLRSSLTITLSLLGIITTFLFIWKVPEQQASGINDSKDRATIENAARGTLVQALGGLGLFVTAYFALQNLKVAQNNLKATQDKQTQDAKIAENNLKATQQKQAQDAEIAENNLKVTEEKQVTERFAKAIELLGNENIHVRLGAIYALERISKDSGKDYWQVMEILTAYVRETSPYPPKEQRDKADNTPLWANVLRLHQENNNSTVTNSLEDIPPITTDLQAVLTVITRRTKNYGEGEENRLNFSKSNLRGAYMAGAIRLEGGHLYGANLKRVNLKGAYLKGAILEFSNLERADLEGADLEGAYLRGAYLSRARNINPEQVKSARNWEKAEYDKDFRAQLGLPPEADE